ncbi:MAG: ABC transporter substrate-binding protein, partial [Candidatus Electrothrix sp. ATG1]|nr:ABC transporter substrate-binding protein [Candidatus Electrothrix sp. ATG1]
MQNFRYALIPLLFFLLFLPASSVSAAVPDPTEQLKPVVDKVVALLRDADFRKRPVIDQSEHIVQIVSERFDFREMSKRVMGKQWRTLNTEQQDQFIALFTKLLQYIYIAQVDDHVDKEIKFTRQRIKRDRAEVTSLLVSDD